MKALGVPRQFTRDIIVRPIYIGLGALDASLAVFVAVIPNLE